MKKTEKVSTMEPQKSSEQERLQKAVSPILIQIKNVSDEEKPWKLFGFNHFSRKRRFGNDTDVRITSLSNCSYDDYFNNTAREEFIIGKSRIMSADKGNLIEEINHCKFDIWSGVYTKQRFTFLAMQKDAYQQQSDLLDITHSSDIKYKIDQTTHLEGTIRPNSKIIIALFPIQHGKTLPRLSGKCPAPVIIHTTQKWTSESPLPQKPKRTVVKKAQVKPVSAKAKSRVKAKTGK